jgi:tRNA A-37 threonylcarbamoyl transferase component Bud32
MRLQTSGRTLLLCALAALVLLAPAAARAQSENEIELLTLDDVSDETIGIIPAPAASPPENAPSSEPAAPPEPAETTRPADTDWLTRTTRAIASPAVQPAAETTRPMASPAVPPGPEAPEPIAPPTGGTATARQTTRPMVPTGDDPPPGLAEATGDAVTQVLDAARRDGASLARRTSEIRQHVLARVRQEWNQLLDSPVTTFDRWLAAAGLPDAQTLALPALGAVAVLLLLLKLLRGKGDLTVSIEYPAELRGTFSVRIARKKSARKGPHTATPAAAQRAKRRASASSRTERHLVSRETGFREILAGRWYVTVDGFMQPPDEEAVIGSYFEEQEIQVRRGHTARLDFDFRPKQCPVDAKVLWDKRPVSEALVAWRGAPHSLRYARGGPVRLGAERGIHTLVVGSGDRVAELEVQVDSFQSINVTIDLADREKLLFTGCPPAVEPYLYGDISAAARALEREGKGDLSHLLLARLHEERQQDEAAARHYAEAGSPLRAAEIHEKLAHYEQSAALFESAGELTRAAEMYRSAGEIEKAGDVFERSRDYQRAAECFREAGSTSRWVEALEKAGDPFEAAKVALEHGDQCRAIRSLQLLGPSDSDYVEAANLLVDVLQKEGHLDMAQEKIEQVIRSQGAESVPLETCDRLAKLLEDGEQYQRALDMLDIIRRRDATYPNIATRIEDLRKRCRQQASKPSAASVPGGEAFSGGFRYEILEEVGRGGMGIVFKARDRRLGRVVALKRLPDNLRNHPKAVELFLREARAAAALNHPNIVTVHDAGQEGESFYITMELLEGLPLQQILKRNGRIGPRDVARLGVQVLKGLHYAHEQRIIHRDIKTGNLFFTKNNTVKIMDFGLAKMVEEVRRASTVVGGTPYYMAPEQSLGRAVDARADLYALGVTFFELLTGRVPFAEGDVAFHHRHTPAPDPREHAAGIPDAFAELVLEMMAKEPDARPATAAAVRERLHEIIDTLT